MTGCKHLFRQTLILFLLQATTSAPKEIDTSNPDETLDFETTSDFRRPVWNVAHMVNALYQLDHYLDMGANSVEFDVAFDWEGTAKYTFHGVPCDCFRSCTKHERFVTYLDYLRQLTTPGDPRYRKQLALLFMDVKVSGLSPAAKRRAGRDVAEKIIEYYWKGGQSNSRSHILLSVPSINHREFVESFRETLRVKGFSQYLDRIGVDFSGNEDLDLIKRALKGLGFEDHIWQGDGITNCLPRGTSRLRDALSRRDRASKESNFVDKVYWWTVDRMSTMRTVLRLGVDAMITNYPERLVSVLDEEEFSGKFRMATFEDSPWKRHDSPFASLISLDAGVQGRGGNLTSDEEEILFNGDDDILFNC